MKTLMETIESWKPCLTYSLSVAWGVITPQMTIRDFLYSRCIREQDKEWGITRLLDCKFRVDIDDSWVSLTELKNWKTYSYDYETFLSMLDTYMESQETMEEEDD